MTVYVDDKRLLSSSEHILLERDSERDWHYCEHCYRDAPTFVLTEALFAPDGKPGDGPVRVQRLRCCWECGSGLERL